MSETISPEPILEGCGVRRFRPEDANGVPRLVQAVYGDSYYPPVLYDPEQVARLNENGKLVSVVAVNAALDLIGHYALELFPLAAVAEASDAIVAPGYRHHHLM